MSLPHNLICFKQVVNHQPTNNNKTHIFVNLRNELEQFFCEFVEDGWCDDVEGVGVDEEFHEEELDVVFELGEVGVEVHDVD